MMVHVTPESVHQVHVLDLPACRTEDRRHGLLLGQVRCGGEASFPPSRAPCAKDRALTHSTPRRHPVVGLRPSPPEPDAEAVNHDMQCTLDPARSRDGRAVLLGVPPAPIRGDRGNSAKHLPGAGAPLPVPSSGSRCWPSSRRSTVMFSAPRWDVRQPVKRPSSGSALPLQPDAPFDRREPVPRGG